MCLLSFDVGGIDVVGVVSCCCVILKLGPRLLFCVCFFCGCFSSKLEKKKLKKKRKKEKLRKRWREKEKQKS